MSALRLTPAGRAVLGERQCSCPLFYGGQQRWRSPSRFVVGEGSNFAPLRPHPLPLAEHCFLRLATVSACSASLKAPHQQPGTNTRFSPMKAECRSAGTGPAALPSVLMVGACYAVWLWWGRAESGQPSGREHRQAVSPYPMGSPSFVVVGEGSRFAPLRPHPFPPAEWLIYGSGRCSIVGAY